MSDTLRHGGAWSDRDGTVYRTPCHDVLQKNLTLMEADRDERLGTNHDAAPAATARTDADSDRTDKAAPRPGTGAGETVEPVAWAALRDDGDIAWLGFTPDGVADGACGRRIAALYLLPTLTDAEREDLEMWLAECLRQASTATDGGNEDLAERWQGRALRAAALLERLAPLYRHPQPTLTDAEREAVEFFAELPWAKESGNAAEAAVLRGLLERLGGGE